MDRRTMLLAGTAIVTSSQTVSSLFSRDASAAAPLDVEWHNYARDLANTRYAPLEQINSSNFSKLEIAWRFRTDNLGARPEYQYECTPLMIGGRLYATAGARRAVVCLDAETGELKWVYSLDEGERGLRAPRQLSGRGCAYWTNGRGDDRIIYVTPGYRMIALNAHTGQPVSGFGHRGIVDLKMDDDQKLDPDTAEIGLHATPLVADDTIVVGAAHLSGDVPKSISNVKGYVRGFDVVSGRRKWIFHTIPRKGEFGYDTWLQPGDAERAGNTGCWAQMAADLELGLVYLPVELPTGDFVGIYRKGPGLFGESLVAIEIKTGRRRWHYQTIHHGLWDRDLPCAPILCDIPHEGRIVKALAQPSKQGFLYVLDRTTGKPVWPIPEEPVPAGAVPGEWYSPTQPIPSRPPAYEVQKIDANTVLDFTPQLHAQALELISHYRTGGVYEPPAVGTSEGLWGALMTPGSQGGTNWPGGCYDPETHIVYVFSQRIAQPQTVVPVTDHAVSEFAYVRGVPGGAVVRRAAMGASGYTGSSSVEAGPQGQLRPGQVTVQGLPLMKPPYGQISAIDLTKGDILWQTAHGETPDAIKHHPALKGLNIPRTGRPGLVGPLVTKALVICGEAGFATTPEGVPGAMLRAYDKRTGAEMGAVVMPAPQTGAPMSYMLAGRQYVVVATGGGSHTGELVAFRLPKI